MITILNSIILVLCVLSLVDLASMTSWKKEWKSSIFIVWFLALAVIYGTCATIISLGRLGLENTYPGITEQIGDNQ